MADPALINEPGDAIIKRYHVYLDSRTGDPFKLVYYDEEDDVALLKYIGNEDITGSKHNYTRLSSFKKEQSAGRWKHRGKPDS